MYFKELNCRLMSQHFHCYHMEIWCSVLKVTTKPKYLEETNFASVYLPGTAVPPDTHLGARGSVFMDFLGCKLAS